MLVANQVRVPFWVPPPELTFAAGDQASKRLFAIPPTTILSLQYPCGGAPRFWCPDVFTHQARESSPILAREPMSELPEDGSVHSVKDGRRIVSVSIEVRPSRECPVQAFHQVHAVPAVIARQFLDQLGREASVLLPWDRRDRSQLTSWAPLADDAVAEEDHAVVHMGDRGLLHIQRERERPFQKRPARVAYCLCVRCGSFDDHDEIIRIATGGDAWFPLPVLSYRNRSLREHAEVPCPSVLPHLLAQVVRFHPSIEFMQHDVGEQRREDTPLWNTFARGAKEPPINTPCFDARPQQGEKALISDTFADAFQ